MFGLVGDFLKSIFANPIPLIVAAIFAYWTGFSNGKAGRAFWKPKWPWAAIILALCAAPSSAQAAHYRHRAGWTLPDSIATPGVVRTIDRQAICTGTTKTVRHTTASMKAVVYAEYGIRSHPTGAFEIDHLIPLELGGADTVANLWPQPARPIPGFRQKDLTENWLHRAICTGRITPDSAQRWIVHDFPGAYAAMLWQRVAHEP